MALHVNVAGVWKGGVVLWVNVAGVWKKAGLWLNVAGVWKQITSLISATLNNADYYCGKLGGSQAVAIFTISSTGNVMRPNNTGTGVVLAYAWIGANPNTDYQVRVHVNSQSGSQVVSGTFDTWAVCNVDRNWTLGSGNAGLESQSDASLLVEIGDLSGNVIASATVGLHPSWSSGV
jgi:hypothetical protein